MRLRIQRNILPWAAVFLLLGTLTNCVLPPSTGQILYQQGRSIVRLEADPQAIGLFGSESNTHPVAIEAAQLATLLHGIGIRSEQGFVAAVLSLAAPAEPVFNVGELTLLTPILSRGLAQAGPSERVGFTLWSTQPVRRNAPLSGYVSVRDPYLKFVLNDHPSIGWQDPEDPSSPKLFDLDFLREGFLLPGTDEERKGSYKARPVIQIDYRGYLRSLADQGGQAKTVTEPVVPAPADTRPSSAPPRASQREAAVQNAETLQELQRQVKELTDSNQGLRAKLKELMERREEAPEQSKGANEELTRLRQELAETKQLLADKVLELNRLKNKSGGTNKDKAPASSGR